MACVLALSSADTATVGASATQLRQALHISNTDIGVLVAINALVAAVASVPFGILVDKVKRTRLLWMAIVLWGVAMLWSATVSSFGKLLLARLFLGIVTAVAGPVVASLVGDYFPSHERGRVYGWILTGELLGAGVGFAVTGDIAALSWRAAFVILSLPTFALAYFASHMPEPVRGGGKPLLREGSAAAEADDMSDVDRMRSGVSQVQDGSQETDAQRLARERGVAYDRQLVEAYDLPRIGFRDAVRYILNVRTNVVLIVASACGYFYLSGVQTFGVEFAKEQYSINQALANLLLLVLGGGAVVGTLVAGHFSDSLPGRGHLNARVVISGAAAGLTAALFIPALTTRGSVTALPYLTIAAFFLAAQNPPIDAARLDIMPALLWGRAEGVRTALRTGVQALAPVLFGFSADHIFGGGRGGLQWTFLFMLIPLSANAVLLFRAMRTYPRDVATAAAASHRARQKQGLAEDADVAASSGESPTAGSYGPPTGPPGPGAQGPGLYDQPPGGQGEGAGAGWAAGSAEPTAAWSGLDDSRNWSAPPPIRMGDGPLPQQPAAGPQHPPAPHPSGGPPRASSQKKPGRRLFGRRSRVDTHGPQPADAAQAQRRPDRTAPSAPAEGPPTQRAPTYGAPTYGAPAGGGPTQGAPTYGAPTQGTPPQGAPPQGRPDSPPTGPGGTAHYERPTSAPGLDAWNRPGPGQQPSPSAPQRPPTAQPPGAWEPGPPPPLSPTQGQPTPPGTQGVPPTLPFTDRWRDETDEWPEAPHLPPANWHEPEE